MKRYGVIILMLWCNSAFAADSTVVKFMNSIYKQLVDTTYKYYYVIS